MASLPAVLLQRSSSRAREYLRLQRTAGGTVALHLERLYLHWWWSGGDGRYRLIILSSVNVKKNSSQLKLRHSFRCIYPFQHVIVMFRCNRGFSGHSLLRDPRHNKGLSFTEKERDAHYLRGLLPPVVLSQDLQEKRLLQNVRQFQVPLQRYMSLMDLQERNERLFYKLLIDNVEELLPVVYTPTVGEACQKYGSIFRRPQGLYISLKEKWGFPSISSHNS
ncbi:NADP-dependent malic enzyme 3 [Dichanthelium oligosanthes]|uniref:NADP-dependent malic enzyme 3 n=1 Tax=Dichanthelium oligosanthes TaxID=888268 RepID=A0A1E5V4K7_9POAL|nr:NADP-dependent malic enzyme 3 [Dichanthelium oligosanthes]